MTDNEKIITESSAIGEIVASIFWAIAIGVLSYKVHEPILGMVLCFIMGAKGAWNASKIINNYNPKSKQ